MAKVDLQVRGSADLARVGARLREFGDKGLTREVQRGLQRATKPMREAGQRAAASEFPQAGGLADRVVSSKFSSRSQMRGRNPGVRIVVSGGLDLDAVDRRGIVRHPVYGNRDVWVDQRIKPEIISGAFEEKAPVARVEIDKVLTEAARKLERP